MNLEYLEKKLVQYVICVIKGMNPTSLELTECRKSIHTQIYAGRPIMNVPIPII
ncbi:hypothetical protein MmTuc01_3109 [Methanosarcina mazei Tuc01]|uniref:Uncharacterized protein n=1 Tax=Methanosarcina mazei Tuc01 TaxID=1236903 RepID=M1Q1C8_METMZ|nr:hypothetical protein MmTuc01_3109 [Methanosarcina mazei Tuc01]